MITAGQATEVPAPHSPSRSIAAYNLKPAARQGSHEQRRYEPGEGGGLGRERGGRRGGRHEARPEGGRPSRQGARRGPEKSDRATQTLTIDRAIPLEKTRLRLSPPG